MDASKNKIRLILSGIIIFTFAFSNNALSQDFIPDSLTSIKVPNDTSIKNISASYAVDRVYLSFSSIQLPTTVIYKIERSADGTNFEPIGKIIQERSDVPIQIRNTYVDKEPYCMKAFYRIKRYDSDGNQYTSGLTVADPYKTNEGTGFLVQTSTK